MRNRSLGFESLEDRTVPANFTVTSLADTGVGSLRDAVDQANTFAGSDVINFTPGLTGVITLTSGELDITDDLSIVGSGADKLTVSGSDFSRIFNISAPATPRLTVSIAGLTLTDGNGNNTPVGLRDGGAVLSTGTATLTILDSIIKDSVGSDGGGVAAFGIDNDLIIRNTKILNNQSVGTLSNGGGVSVSGRAFQFENSTADGNTSSSSGGGLSIRASTGVVTGSTISNNKALTGGGGGLQGGLQNSITITNSTIADNQANGGFSGAGILAFNIMAINNSTIVRNIENSQGGTAGINAFIGSKVTLLSSLVAENNVPGTPTFFSQDVHGSLTSLGNNFISDSRGSSGTTWLASDILDKPSHLPALADNGGPTLTILPEGASFANGNGSNPLGLATDQRGIGFPRSKGNTDIGAVTGTNPKVNPGSNGSNTPTGGSTIVGVVNSTKNLSSVGYIRALYFTILGRDADTVGLSAYTKSLANGESREAIARSIWTSNEHRNLQVAGYYQTYLGRSGTQGEIDSWVGAMESGASEEDVISAFVGSTEYRSRFASNDLYVSQLYQDVIGRLPTSEELAVQTNKLNGGGSTLDVARSVVTSSDARIAQLTSLYQHQLLRTPPYVELALYQSRFGDSALISEWAIELAASDEMFALGQSFIPVTP